LLLRESMPLSQALELIARQLQIHMQPAVALAWYAPLAIPRPPLNWHLQQEQLRQRFPHLHLLGTAFGPPGVNGALRQAQLASAAV
jgi:hypothetical protein